MARSGIKQVVIENQEGIVILPSLRVADDFISRLVGLLGTKSLDPKDGLWIRPCDSIHMWGMQYPIDVVFISEKHEVVKLFPNVKPGAAIWPVRGAHSVFELPVGKIAETGLKVGDQLTVLPAGTP